MMNHVYKERFPKVRSKTDELAQHKDMGLHNETVPLFSCCIARALIHIATEEKEKQVILIH